MEPITTGTVLGVLALSQAAGHVLNWYKGKRDGSFQEQQEFLAEVREKEARRSHENLLARDRELRKDRRQEADTAYERALHRDRQMAEQREQDARAAHERALERDRILAGARAQEATVAHQRSLERDLYLTKLRIEEAELAFEWSRQLAVVQSRIQVDTQQELQRLAREQANSPFAYDVEKVREKVLEKTGGGNRPVLIIAPFHYEDSGQRNGAAEPGSALGIRQAWLTSAWSLDAEPFAGLVTRPLIWPDADVQTIRTTLHDLPVILVQGQVQANTRLWLSLSAWNLGDTSGTRVVDTHFPPMLLPGAEAGERPSPLERLAFEDHIAELVTLTAGAHAEWFHILKSGRAPRLHNLLPAGRDSDRRVLAANSAALYEVCAERGIVSPERARLTQAVVLAEGGHETRAVDVLRSSLALLGSTTAKGARDPELADLLSRLVRLVEERADPGAKRLFATALDELREQALLHRFGWGDLD
ncbi:hypothetical protein [Streptomyces sp. NPDC002265]|uniref:hypothetical protein n=1 Tax=Streptomyces sp. NPDC002265 TaxID=3154415 RepID=UPI0033235419